MQRHEFIETEIFTNQVDSTGDRELLEAIQSELEKNPEAGNKLGGGIRKARVKSPIRKEGKSGGYRCFYFRVTEKYQIYLLFLLDKKDGQNISKGQEKALIQILKNNLSK